MAYAVAWLGALKRLERLAFQRSAGERIRILSGHSLTPGRSWQRPELQVIEQERRVEFVLNVAGAKPDATQVVWNEDDQTLTVHAPVESRATLPAGTPAPASGNLGWYAEIPVPSDVDASRAKAVLQHGTLRIVAPRIDSLPLTGCPLWVWPNAASNSALAAT